MRLICATNRDLEAMAKTGAFRDDLFYRLSVMTLELPPLRSYKDNLEVLANVFLEQSATAHGKQAPRLGPDVLARLPGVRLPRQRARAQEHDRARGDPVHRRRARASRICRKPLQDPAPQQPRARDRSRRSSRSTRRARSGSRRSSAST